MIKIPTTVKINGSIVWVQESPRGYVRVGQSCSDIPIEQKEAAEKLEGREAVEYWQSLMWTAFEIALKAERKRLKKGGLR